MIQAVCYFGPLSGGCEGPIKPYPCGDRCTGHAPRPINPTPDPARTLNGLRAAAGLPMHPIPPRSASWAAIDARAIASGRRRSNADDYASARSELARQAESRADAGGGR